MIYFTQAELDRFIEEDVPYHDETTHALGIDAQPASMSFSAKDEGFVLCGSEEAVRMAQSLGALVTLSSPSGRWIAPGEMFLCLEGSAACLHKVWRAALIVMETASGVATRTRAMVDEAREANPNVRVATTRKAPPGLRKLMFKAVLAGGGTVHRAGLSETVLIFAHHRVFLGDEPLAQTCKRLREASPEKKIMIEADSLDEALAYAYAGADVIQLEKMPLEKLQEAVVALRARFPRLVISSTGGVTLSNAAAQAATGVDMLVTSHPYHAPPADIRAVMRPMV
ncbi:MAG: ModD protein [Halothiobacillaceae bacterium]|nr:ModD protein [Halothiobacillaceae bacterium]